MSIISAAFIAKTSCGSTCDNVISVDVISVDVISVLHDDDDDA